MKLSITISDLGEQEAYDILERLNGDGSGDDAGLETIAGAGVEAITDLVPIIPPVADKLKAVPAVTPPAAAVVPTTPVPDDVAAVIARQVEEGVRPETIVPTAKPAVATSIAAAAASVEEGVAKFAAENAPEPPPPYVPLELPKVTAPTAELDPLGIPWDKRIHSSGKTQTKKGFWVKKRGVHDKIYDQVLAELQVEHATPTEGDVPDVALLKAQNTVEMTEAAIVGARDFAGLINQVNALFVEPARANPDYLSTMVERINTGFGTSIVALTDLADESDMVAYAWDILETDKLAV